MSTPRSSETILAEAQQETEKLAKQVFSGDLSFVKENPIAVKESFEKIFNLYTQVNSANPELLKSTEAAYQLNKMMDLYTDLAKKINPSEAMTAQIDKLPYIKDQDERLNFTRPISAQMTLVNYESKFNEAKASSAAIDPNNRESMLANLKVQHDIAERASMTAKQSNNTGQKEWDKRLNSLKKDLVGIHEKNYSESRTVFKNAHKEAKQLLKEIKSFGMNPIPEEKAIALNKALETARIASQLSQHHDVQKFIVSGKSSSQAKNLIKESSALFQFIGKAEDILSQAQLIKAVEPPPLPPRASSRSQASISRNPQSSLVTPPPAIKAEAENPLIQLPDNKKQEIESKMKEIAGQQANPPNYRINWENNQQTIDKTSIIGKITNPEGDTNVNLHKDGALRSNSFNENTCRAMLSYLKASNSGDANSVPSITLRDASEANLKILQSVCKDLGFKEVYVNQKPLMEQAEPKIGMKNG